MIQKLDIELINLSFRHRKGTSLFIILFVVMQACSLSVLGCANGKRTTTLLMDSMHDGGLYLEGAQDTSIRKTRETKFMLTTIKSLSVSALIVNGMAEVTMEHTFQTPECFPDDYEFDKAIYQLPLEIKQTVTSFQAEFDGRVIDAVLEERTEAESLFQYAHVEGATTFLVEEKRADVFHIVLGNIPALQDVTISLTYVTPLITLGPNALKFEFPTYLSPDDIDGDLEVTFALNIYMSAKIMMIRSALHELSIDNVDDHKALVHVTNDDPTTGNMDVLISLASEPMDLPQIYIDSSATFDSTAVILSIASSKTETMTIEWGEKSTVVMLTRNVRVFAFNLFTGQNTFPDSVVLRFSSGSMLEISSDSFIQLNNVNGEYDFLHQIACHSLIRELENDETGNQEVILSMALKYGIASSQTSFVAVDNLDWKGVTDIDGENDNNNAYIDDNDDDDDNDGGANSTTTDDDSGDSDSDNGDPISIFFSFLLNGFTSLFNNLFP